MEFRSVIPLVGSVETLTCNLRTTLAYRAIGRKVNRSNALHGLPNNLRVSSYTPSGTEDRQATVGKP